MKLPMRSRSHQLEELSVNKFKSLLPITWVYRTPTDDYGIDGEVEIFDEKGYATGKKFLIQLKATDESDLTKSLMLRMGIEKFNYYNKLDQPVLIVRYLASTDDVYVRWFHSHNSVDDRIAENSFCLSFHQNHKWEGDKLERIVGELEGYFAFTKHPLKKPIKVNVLITPGSLFSKYALQFVTKLIRSSDNGGKIFSFGIELDRLSTPSFIEFSNDENYISLGGVTSIRSNFDAPMESDDVDVLVADVNISLAILLQNLGYSAESEILFDAFFEASSMCSYDYALHAFVGAKAKTNKLGDALDYLVRVVEKRKLKEEGLINAVQVIMALVTRISAGREDKKIELTYLSLAESARAIDTVLPSVFHYNLGSFLSSRNRNRDAVKHYLFAAKLNPDYKLRAYWQRELAGLFFYIGKYHWAMGLYEHLLEVDSSPETRALFADSLMFAGFFKRALDEFSLALNDIEDRDAEWCLKAWCLEQIVNQIGVEVQSIGPCAGQKFMEGGSEDEAINYLKSTNALCPDCWFFIASKLAERSEFQGASVCYLLSAFADEGYKDSWMRALHCSMVAKDSVLGGNIMQLVSKKFGSEPIGEFFASFGDGDNPEVQQIALQAIKACETANQKSKHHDFEVRFGNSQNQESIYLK